MADDASGANPAERRFTVDYDPTEDRIALTLHQGEATERIWLTRRLLVRAIPELVRVLEAAAAAAHRAALGALAPETRPAGDADEAQPLARLATGLRFRGRPDALTVELKGAGGLLHAMTLGETALRQWLALLQQNFVRAEWDDDIWPGWLAPLDPGAAPAGLRLN